MSIEPNIKSKDDHLNYIESNYIKLNKQMIDDITLRNSIINKMFIEKQIIIEYLFHCPENGIEKLKSFMNDNPRMSDVNYIKESEDRIRYLNALMFGMEQKIERYKQILEINGGSNVSSN